MSESTDRNGRRHTSSEPTDCGAVMLGLMDEQGVRTQAQLIDRLYEKSGIRYSQQRISSWIYGKAAINKEFPERFADALSLSDEQRMRWAMAVAYGQAAPTATKG